MGTGKADIIAQLRKDILPLQGFKAAANSRVDVGLAFLNNSFPNAVFPTGAVHEFVCDRAEDVSATGGFMTGIISALMGVAGVSLWISTGRQLFPPALAAYGLQPDKIIFIDLLKERDVLWALEEALKCAGIAAVVGEVKEISLTASRRLQLAVEQSGVTGFIVRRSPQNQTTACISRWKISSIASQLDNEMPGVGFPCWKVELLKIRNGHPGSWKVTWAEGCFHHLPEEIIIEQEEHKQTG